MGTIVRTYNYISGNVIIAEQNNFNENTLYNTINGNITDDNLGVVTEAAITFQDTGHEHGGGTDGSKINLAQDTSGDDYLMQLSATATGNALIVKCSSAVAGKAGILAQGENAVAYGLKVDHTQAGSVSLRVENAGLGIGAQFVSAAGNSGHALEINHGSTNSTQKAGLYVSSVADEDHHGIWIPAPEGRGILIQKTGVTAEKPGIEIQGDLATAPQVQLTTSAAGAALKVDHAAASGSAIIVNAPGGGTAKGIDVDVSGGGTATGIEISGANSRGLRIEGSHANMQAISISGSSGADTATPYISVSHAAGEGITITSTHATAARKSLDISSTSISTASGFAAARIVGNTASTAGTTTGVGWVLVVNNANGASNARDCAYFGGRVYVAGTFDALDNKGFLNPNPKDDTKALRYICLEGPENAVFWRTSTEITRPRVPAVIQVPDFVTDCIPEGEELDVFASRGEAFHNPETKTIHVVTERPGRVSLFCLGTRRYYEDHAPVVDHDWSESREKVGSSAYRAYGPQ